jgi:hypothetical protein
LTGLTGLTGPFVLAPEDPEQSLIAFGRDQFFLHFIQQFDEFFFVQSGLVND